MSLPNSTFCWLSGNLAVLVRPPHRPSASMTSVMYQKPLSDQAAIRPEIPPTTTTGNGRFDISSAPGVAARSNKASRMPQISGVHANAGRFALVHCGSSLVNETHLNILDNFSIAKHSYLRGSDTDLALVGPVLCIGIPPVAVVVW